MSKQINKDEFQAEVLNNNGIVIVDFFATWCGPCKMLAPVLENIEERTGIKTVKVNIDEEPAFSTENNVEVVPTVIIYKDGQKVNRFEGYREEDEILDILNNIN